MERRSRAGGIRRPKDGHFRLITKIGVFTPDPLRYLSIWRFHSINTPLSEAILNSHAGFVDCAGRGSPDPPPSAPPVSEVWRKVLFMHFYSLECIEFAIFNYFLQVGAAAVCSVYCCCVSRFFTRQPCWYWYWVLGEQGPLALLVST